MSAVIKAKVRGFMCITSHPEGCKTHVKEQIEYVVQQGIIDDMPKRVLVIGASTGYGLATRITAAFAGGAATLGVFFERSGDEKRPATAGWYNTAAFHEFAEEQNLYAKSFNGDAFSHAMKDQVIETIKEDLGHVDLVVYSLGAPRRTHPDSGDVFKSTLKPIGQAVSATTVDTDKKVIKTVDLEAATQQEIDDTIAVMGGEDWKMWIEALDEAGVLAPGCKTTAYTYLGDKITWDIYWNGTIGEAKKDLDNKVVDLAQQLQENDGDAFVSVLKAVVTQSSSAIPIMPLYLALLFKVMKEEGTHEGCIEQIYALFRTALTHKKPVTDDERRIRMDGKELSQNVQQAIEDLWPKINDDNIDELTDFAGYQTEFLRLFGFEMDGIDYEQAVELEREIKNLIEVS